MALVKQSSLWSSMLLEVMWGLDIQSLSILGGDLDQTLFTFCFESITSVLELSRDGGVNFGSLQLGNRLIYRTLVGPNGSGTKNTFFIGYPPKLKFFVLA